MLWAVFREDSAVSSIPLFRWLLLAALSVSPLAAADDCRQSTKATTIMAEIVAWPEDAARPLLLADDTRTRRAGMQWLCPDVVAAQPMLFVFSRPQNARFHGNNVFVDLDLAWLDAEGRVLDVVRLPRKGEVAYDRPIAAVLEASAGSFERWGLEPGMRIPFSPSLEQLIRNAR